MGVGFGVVLAVIYFCLRLKRNQDRNVEDVIGVFGYVVGIAGGVQVCWVAFAERLTPPIGRVSLQMFAGGFALIFFAVNKILKKFRED